MKTGIWPVLILVLFLAGCAAGGYSRYEPYPYEERPWYFDDRFPPLPVSPEALGSLPGGHNPAMRPWFHPGGVNPDNMG